MYHRIELASWGPSIKDVGNLKGGGVTIPPNLPMDRRKKMSTWGRGAGQKLKNIADILYGAWMVPCVMVGYYPICVLHERIMTSLNHE